MMLPSKRPAPDHHGHGSGDDDDDQRFGAMVPEPKRRATLKNAVRNIMGLGGLSLNRIVLNMEPMLRSWVREEVERAFSSSFHPSSSRSSLNQIEACRETSLQLQFVNKLPSTIFTGSKVEAEDGNPIGIILVDPTSQMIVSSASLSSIKIEILVLNGDFGADEREDWTENEFNASVLREREGKRPLVTGDLYLTLVDGVGTVDNVIFTDNSSWIRSRKFRLGARIVQRISGGVTIREARSEAFVVKDQRGELYKKHYPPVQCDEVWRLERIAKDGAFHKRLASRNILTVKDLLRLYVTDPSTLRHILGGGISNRVWDTIIEHALSCDLDADEWYTYYGAAAQRVELRLNSIYQVVAAKFDGQNYEPVEKLNFFQKSLVEEAKRQAYRNGQDLVLTDGRAIMGPSMPYTNLMPEPNLLVQQPDFSVENQDQPDTPLSFNQSSTTYAYEDDNQLLVCLPQAQDGQAFNAMLRNSFPYNGENSLSLFPDDEAQMPSWTTPPDLFGSSLGILTSSPYRQSMGEPRDVWPKAGWLKLRAVIQWRSIRRGAARRRHWFLQGICI